MIENYEWRSESKRTSQQILGKWRQCVPGLDSKQSHRDLAGCKFRLFWLYRSCRGLLQRWHLPSSNHIGDSVQLNSLCQSSHSNGTVFEKKSRSMSHVTVSGWLFIPAASPPCWYSNVASVLEQQPGRRPLKGLCAWKRTTWWHPRPSLVKRVIAWIVPECSWWS